MERDASAAPDDRLRRRRSIREAFGAVTDGPRVRLTATITVPVTLLERNGMTVLLE